MTMLQMYRTMFGFEPVSSSLSVTRPMTPTIIGTMQNGTATQFRMPAQGDEADQDADATENEGNEGCDFHRRLRTKLVRA